MQRFKRLMVVVMVGAFVLSGLPAFAASPVKDQSAADYVAAADVDYAHDITVKMSKIGNGPLGFSNAGSPAEIKKAKLLAAEMKKIGLKDVHMDSFAVDAWTFKGATAEVVAPEGTSKKIVMSTYATQGTSAEGLTGELVYVNKGTKYDYDGIDVTGKIVLIDIDMNADWWITYPALQAVEKGAAAVICSCSGGYAMLNDDTMNSQDFVGPVTIPTFNISRNDANYLKELLKNGDVKLNLKSDNSVTDGNSYNIVGMIPGKTDKEYVIVGDHYDTHFTGFQDDCAAVGLTLGIAKGLIDSKYQPERTIIFVLHGSEEYGAIDTRYDWSIGAWNQIFKLHPEWAGKVMAYINFELPAYEHKSIDEIRTTPELKTFLDGFLSEIDKPVGCYADGAAVSYPLRTWSDDWSYSIAGVPSLRNDFGSGVEGGINPQGGGFSETRYHSQFDDETTYDADVLKYHLDSYGLMAIAFDKSPVVPLDFTIQLDMMEKSIDDAGFAAAGVDPAALKAEIAEFKAVAADKYAQVSKLNALYYELTEKQSSGDKDVSSQLEACKEAGIAANQQLLAAYKTIQGKLIRLNWFDTPIYAHERMQKNIPILQQGLTDLKAGNAGSIVDDQIFWEVDDQWYSYYFDKAVCDHFAWQVLGQPTDRLFWGTGKIVGRDDLWNVINEVTAKKEAGSTDFAPEITQLDQYIASEKSLMAVEVNKEIKILHEAELQMSGVDLTSAISSAEGALN